MKVPSPAIGRIALLASLLAATGCSTSPIDALTALVTPEAPAAHAAAPITSVPLAPPPGFTAAAMHAGGNDEDDEADEPAFRPGNSEVAVAGEALAGAGDRIAMLPLPRPSGRVRKPDFAGGPICGELAPGGRSVGMLASGGLRFTVECFRAKSAKPGPAVIILHGARGIGRNPIYERLAEQLVERGQSAFILQYLSGQDDPVALASVVPSAKGPAKAPAKAAAAKPPAAKPATTKVAALRGKGQPRKQTVDAEGQTEAIETAITAVQALSYVNHERIGLFGLSLGGFHALAIASRDHRVGAVVDMFGAMPRPVHASVERMPPTLVLHGERDAVVPVRRAHELAKLLKTVGAVHEVKIYKGQGHSFTGAADQDSVERTVAFLVRHLGEPTARDG